MPKMLLVSLLQDNRVPHEEMERRYPALIGNMKASLKGYPTGPCYLEVWPPGLESYTIAFGLFFNRHFSSDPAKYAGVYLLAGMQTGVCTNANYVQAASVIIAATTGKTSEEKIVAVVAKNRAVFSPRENLALDVAEALSKRQPTLTKDKKAALVAAFGARAEHIVFTVAGFTFLIKFTHTIAVELEQRTADVAAGTIGKFGWTPGSHDWLLDPGSEPLPFPKRETFMERLKRVKYLPGVLAFVQKAERGVPSQWPQLEPFLQSIVGHNFPVLQQVQNASLRKGLAALIVRNLEPETSVCGLSLKCLAGMMFATFVKDPQLERAVRDMSAKFGTSDKDLQKAKDFVLSEDAMFCDSFSSKQLCALLALCKSILPTPCQMKLQVVDHLREVDVGGTVVIELVIWVSTLETLHKVMSYYSV